MLEPRQFVTSGFCLRCEGCCRFSSSDTVWSVRLLKQEKERLDKKIRLIANPKESNFTPHLCAGVGFICASFDIRNNKCKIYSLRPFECRLYPFLINRKENKVFLAVDLKCPYIEKNLASQRYKKYIHYLTCFFHNSGIIKILKNNLQIAQIYAGILNISELKI